MCFRILNRFVMVFRILIMILSTLFQDPEQDPKYFRILTWTRSYQENLRSCTGSYQENQRSWTGSYQDSSCQEGISGTSQSTPNFPTTISVFSVNFQFFSPHKFFVKFNEFKRVLMNFDVFWPNPSCGDFGGTGIARGGFGVNSLNFGGKGKIDCVVPEIPS